jgi:phosphate acetyltransferase
MQSVLYLPYINLEVPLDDRDRMQQAVEAVASHITLDWKEPLLTTIEERRLSPPAFQHMLVERARKANKRIILPEGNEPRTIEAAIICHQRGIARCVLMGDAGRMHRLSARRGMSIPPDIEIIDPPRSTGAISMRWWTAPTQGLNAGLAEEAAARPGGAGHHDAATGRSGRAGVRRGAHHRQHHPPGPATDQDRARRPAGLVDLLHVPA